MSLSIPALVLIDLQNGFLTSEGNFPVVNADELLANISILTAHFRSQHPTSPVIWVRAEYPPNHGERSSLPRSQFHVLTGRHSSEIPCCRADTTGAAFHRHVAGLIEERDTVLVKTWYSAFKETKLEEILRTHGVTELTIAGLFSTTCVLAAATDARRLGFEVRVVDDCLGYMDHGKHERAMKSMQDLGVEVRKTYRADGLAEGGKPILPRLYYAHGTIPSLCVIMALKEKDIDFEPVRLEVTGGPMETRRADFLALNHRGKTPLFVDHTAGSTPTIVNESLAILQYIETYFNPEVLLLPPVTDRVARALVLARLQETESLRNECVAFANEEDPVSVDSIKELVAGVSAELDYWEAYASRTTFIAGNNFSLADCAFFPVLACMVNGGIFEVCARALGVAQDGEEAWPNLTKYFERVWDRGGKEICAYGAEPKE